VECRFGLGEGGDFGIDARLAHARAISCVTWLPKSTMRIDRGPILGAGWSWLADKEGCLPVQREADNFASKWCKIVTYAKLCVANMPQAG
jgi:hypothetical protein